MPESAEMNGFKFYMTIPSEFEKYSGGIFDPADALDEIEKANAQINKFIDDMKVGRNPQLDLDSIAAATDLLGLYAGYPSEAANMEGYIKSDMAVSYKEIASMLEGWSIEINALIDARIKHRAKSQKNDSSSDVPF